MKSVITFGFSNSKVGGCDLNADAFSVKDIEAIQTYINNTLDALKGEYENVL